MMERCAEAYYLSVIQQAFEEEDNHCINCWGLHSNYSLLGCKFEGRVGWSFVQPYLVGGVPT